MYRFLRYLFWRLYYLPQRRSRDLASYLIRGQRCWWPWRKFRPSVYHNDDGRCWQIWFANDRAHTLAGKPVVLADVDVSMETGAIVGLTIYDTDLDAVRQHFT